MVRFGLLCVTIATLASGNLHAESADAQVAQTLALQKAMATSRVLLEQNRPREAVEILQKELLHANGNARYLGLMRDALAARVKELQIERAPAEEIEAVHRQLRILDPQAKVEVQVSAAPPPAIAPPEPVEPLAIKPIGNVAPKPTPEGDPFQQTPLDRSKGKSPEKPAAKEGEAQATMAFQEKKYAEANRLFESAQATENLSDEEKAAWGYCKLHVASTRLNASGKDLALNALERETQDAMQLGGEKLEAWGNQVLGEIRKRKRERGNAIAEVPEGWKAVETANFRIVHKGMEDLAGEVARVAEVARSAMYERWSGPVEANWSPKCDIFLHAKGEDYIAATGQSAISPGHSTLSLRGGKVATRRIDLRCDVAEMNDSILPHEVTYVIVHELFADQPLPRWAEAAMTVLSEPPSQVARYLRAVPGLVKEKRIIPLNKLLASTDFPDAAQATPFFAESVSVVDFLVRQKGAKAFAIFLREAPRRGFDKALQTHYGFKDSADLQDKWLKYANGQ